MEYFKLYDVLFIAVNDKRMWIINNSNEDVGKIKGLIMTDIGQNLEFEAAIRNDGIKINQRAFEFVIPKRMTGQEHLNISFYLGNLPDKERKL